MLRKSPHWRRWAEIRIVAKHFAGRLTDTSQGGSVPRIGEVSPGYYRV
jgi:hypothetical protein